MQASERKARRGQGWLMTSSLGQSWESLWVIYIRSRSTWLKEKHQKVINFSSIEPYCLSNSHITKSFCSPGKHSSARRPSAGTRWGAASGTGTRLSLCPCADRLGSTHTEQLLAGGLPAPQMGVDSLFLKTTLAWALFHREMPGFKKEHTTVE